MTVLGGRPMGLRDDVWLLYGSGSPVGDAEADRARGSVYLQTTGSGMAIWSKTASADDTAWTLVGGGGGGTGDVDGPASAVDGNLASFDGTTGKLIQDSLIPAANVIQSTGSYGDPAWITSLAWAKVVTTPTTLAGYGITDAQPLDADLTAIAALGFTAASFMRKTAANTYDLVTTDRIPLFASAITGTPSGTTYLRGDGVWATVTGGSGDVVGPASATDNAIARYDLTTGKIIQNSSVTIADSGSTVINSAASAVGLTIVHASGGIAAFSMQFDASNRGDMFVSSNGNMTWDAVGSSAYTDFNANGTLRFRLRGDVAVNESHGALWVRPSAFASNYVGIEMTSNAVGSVSFSISAGSAPGYTFSHFVNINTANGLRVSGTKVVGAQGATISDPTGGGVQDAEARTAIATIIDRLQAHGLIA